MINTDVNKNKNTYLKLQIKLQQTNTNKEHSASILQGTDTTNSVIK